MMGKLKERVTVPAGSDEAAVMEAVRATGVLDGKTVIKVIYVPDKIINIVAK